MTAPPLDPLGILGALILEDGRSWGAAAEDWQMDDAHAVLANDAACLRRHFLLRARGMSKTSDAAGIALALLLTEAPPMSRSHVYAVDGDQARIALDTVAGFVERTSLSSRVEVRANTVTVKATGATLAIEASDGASAFGLRPWLTIADELGMWPATENHRKLWSAIVSAVPKVPGARLLAIGTAGSPSSLGAEVWRNAEASPFWRTSRRPGPAPWWTNDDIEATRADLTPADWRRLIDVEWAEGDEALTSAEDVSACIRAGDRTLAPAVGRQYVAALDIGTRRDLTALAIGHSETRPAGRTVVIDRVVYWRPGKGSDNRVDLSEVEATVRRLCREYRVDRLRFDRMQAEQLTTNLGKEGLKVEEYIFSTAGTNRLARSMHVALRDRSIELPDDEELRAEATTVRLVETGPGTVKMQNPPGFHDDVFQAVAMVLVDLTERPEVGYGMISSPAEVAARLGLSRGDRPSLNATNPYNVARVRGTDAADAALRVRVYGR